MKLFKSHKSEFDDGEQVRYFVYVKDAVALTIWLGENLDVNGVFNCGAGIPRTWVDLVTAVFTAMGLKPNIEFIDMPEHLRDKYQYYTCAQMRKISDVGFEHTFLTLEEGIQDYVSNYLAQYSLQ